MAVSMTGGTVAFCGAEPGGAVAWMKVPEGADVAVTTITCAGGEQAISPIASTAARPKTKARCPYGTGTFNVPIVGTLSRSPMPQN